MFYFPTFGGVEQVMYELAKRQVAEGHEVHVFCCDSDKNKIIKEGKMPILKILFDFGKKNLQVEKIIEITFSENSANYKLNPQINKQYAQLFGTAEEITEQTIKNDASATQRIQGDETKKISN